MAWIELHDTLPDHPKIIAACNALQVDKDLLVGKLCRLWTWCLTHREDGFIADYEVQTVAEVMRWGGNPDDLFAALSTIPHGYKAGLFDVVDGGFSIHDWDERVVRLLEKREENRKKTRERVARYRDNKRETSNAQVTRYNSVTVTECTPPTVPNQTVPNQTKPAVSRIDDKSALLTKSEMDAMREQQALMNECYDLAESIGLKSSSDRMKCDGCVADYSAEWLIEALKRTANATPDKRNWNYIIKGMLDKWKAAGRIDDGQKPKANVPRRIE